MITILSAEGCQLSSPQQAIPGRLGDLGQYRPVLLRRVFGASLTQLSFEGEERARRHGQLVVVDAALLAQASA